MVAEDGLDDLLTKLGTGRWNYIHFATSAMVTAVLPVYLIGSEFLNPLPTFTCEIPENNISKPINESQCSMMEETVEGGTVTVPCIQWTYDKSMFRSTVSMEWDLVCDRAWLSPFFQTIYTIGCFLGAILGGISANRYGRRWSVRVGTLMTIAATLVLIVAPWLSLALSARFVLGVFNTIMVCPAFMLSMEICEPSLRATVGIMLALPYAIMMVGLSGLAYLIRDWRVLQAAGSAPCLLLLPLVFYVDESPRWLVIRGRHEEAAKVLWRAFTLNQPKQAKYLDLEALITQLKQRKNKSVQTEASKDSPCDPEVVQGASCKSCCESSSPDIGGCVCSSGNTIHLGPDDGFGSWWAGPVALLRTKIMRKLTLVLICVWLLQGVVYLGLPLSSSAFSSPFTYMALMGMVEIPAYSLTAPITKRFGRKAVATTCLITCGALLLSILILKEMEVHLEWLHLSIVLMSYLLVCTAYQVNFLYAPELLPTTLRPWGTAACTLSAYVGFSIPPFLTDYLGETQQWIPAAVFGTCGVLAGLLIFLLPETNGRNLPETVADLIKRENSQNLKAQLDHISSADQMRKNLNKCNFNLL